MHCIRLLFAMLKSSCYGAAAGDAEARRSLRERTQGPTAEPGTSQYVERRGFLPSSPSGVLPGREGPAEPACDPATRSGVEAVEEVEMTGCKGTTTTFRLW